MAEERAIEKHVVRDAEGTVTEEASMLGGVLQGETVLYSRGRVSARLQFHEGRQSGESVFFDDAGRVVTKASYLDGKRHGDVLHYDIWGRVVRKSIYRDGLLHGLTIDYYPSGKAREVANYQDNLLEGETLRLEEDGKVRERLHFHKGREQRPRAGAAALPTQKKAR